MIDDPKYEYRGPETLPFDELIRRGYQLPFYADLSRMPDEERRVIWGFSPVTRKKEYVKGYNRKKARKWEDDIPLTALFLMIYPAQNVLRREAGNHLA